MNRILIINHHPDCLYYIHEALVSLGLEVCVADEKLTRELSPDNSSATVNGMFDVVGRLFPPSKWGFTPTFVSNINHDDVVFTVHGQVAANPVLHNNRVIMDVQNHHWLQMDVPYGENVTFITGHPTFGKDFGCHYVSNYVKPRAIRSNPEYFSCISSWHNYPFFSQFIAGYKELSGVIKIAGSSTAPNGVVHDDVFLDNTLILGHHSLGGIHYYPVNKALDRGIPVYITNEAYYNGGFESLPKEVFMFAEHLSPVEAYDRAKDIDPLKIQSIYRENHNLQKTTKGLEFILKGI